MRLVELQMMLEARRDSSAVVPVSWEVPVVKCRVCGREPMSVHPKRSDLYMCGGCGDCVHRDEPVVEAEPVEKAEVEKASEEDVLRGTVEKKSKKQRVGFGTGRKSRGVKGEK